MLNSRLQESITIDDVWLKVWYANKILIIYFLFNKSLF